MNEKKIRRFFIYAAGLIVLALGLVLNTKSGLGVSPILSIAYGISQIWSISFANVTLVMYLIFVVLEILIHTYMHRGIKQIIADVLQIPLSIVFTRFMKVFSIFIPELSFDGKSIIYEYTIRFIVLLTGLILTGTGAATSLNMRIVPNPGDGIVQAIADRIGKSVGFTKNCIDVFCVALTIVGSLILTGHIYGVGPGTIVAVILVGRTIAIYNSLMRNRLLETVGIRV